MTTLPTPITFDYESLDTETRLFVQKATHEIRSAARVQARSVVGIGERLIAVKARLGHGNYLNWLEAEFEWGERTARRYMTAAEVYGTLFKTDTVSDLIAMRTLTLLASESTPEEAKQEVARLVTSGQRVTETAARQIIATHQPAAPDGHWSSALIPGKYYPVDRRQGTIIGEPFDSSEEARAAYPGLRPETSGYLKINKALFNSYRLVTPTITNLDDSISPDLPTSPTVPTQPEPPYERQYNPKRDGAVKCPACNKITTSWVEGNGSTWVCACGHRMRDDVMTPYEPPSGEATRERQRKTERESRDRREAAERSELEALREENRQLKIDNAKLVAENAELRTENTRLKAEIVVMRQQEEVAA